MTLGARHRCSSNARMADGKPSFKATRLTLAHPLLSWKALMSNMACAQLTRAAA